MSPFVVLGVAHDVDDAGLKRAYFKKLREFPPETAPEKFQQVQEAFETLRDPGRRRAALEPAVPDRARDLMRLAAGAVDPHAALATLKKCIDAFPDLAAAHVMHVSCLAHLKPVEGLAAARELSVRFAADAEVHLLLAHLETGEPRRQALERAMALAPHDRRPLYDDAKELIGAKRFDEALGRLDAAKLLTDRRFVSDDMLEGCRLLVRMERGDALDLSHATEELAPRLVMLAATMIETNRKLYARQLLDRAQALDPKRRPIPFGPSRVFSLDVLPEATRAAVGKNAHSPSNATVRLSSAGTSKGWVLKTPWWVELRPLHLIVRRANGVQVCPVLSLDLQQREADVPLLTCDGADAGLQGLSELAYLFDQAIDQKRRLLNLMSRDLIETEQQWEPLEWTPSSNA
ncbi:MAG: DnaJ domain-containing protein [Myxococcaceae bacterium]|nr:DnaJ domain-containing protein [Myxococcaceae bacterium]